MFFIDVQRVSPVVNWKPNNSGMDKALLSSKNLSVCLSVYPSAHEEIINEFIVCDVIYTIGFGDGTLYFLVHTTPTKTPRALDNAFQLIDARIGNSDTVSNFQCIGNVLSKKVKTFAAGQHLSDEMYNAIFTNLTQGRKGERKVHPGVKTWTPTGKTAELDHLPSITELCNDFPEQSGVVVGSSAGPAQVISSTLSLFVDFEELVRFWTYLTPTMTDVYERKIEAFFELDEVVTINKKFEEIEESWLQIDMEEIYVPTASDVVVIGYCYAIWNRLFTDLVKIGMTRRTPEIRVRELSGAGLPEPFEIVSILPCTNPVKMERKIHAHYASIRKYGKKKEFFTLSRVDVAVYFGSLVTCAMQDQPGRPLTKKRTLKALQEEINALRTKNCLLIGENSSLLDENKILKALCATMS